MNRKPITMTGDNGFNVVVVWRKTLIFLLWLDCGGVLASLAGVIGTTLVDVIGPAEVEVVLEFLSVVEVDSLFSLWKRDSARARQFTKTKGVTEIWGERKAEGMAA